ncbi:signal peptide peptidase, partial [Opisthorchis viverrini]
MDPLNASTVVNATLNATAENIPLSGMVLSSSVLFILAIVPIYFGSFMSQNCRDKANVEVITARDAATFPAYASAALFGVFLLFKFVPKEYINLVVNLHLSFIGIGCMFHVFSPTLSRLFPKSIKNHMFKAEFSKSRETESGDTGSHWEVLSTSSVSLESKEIAGLVVAAGVGAVYFFTRHWLPNNFLAVCLSLVAIENIRLNKFVNGFMLLGGLFFYDIFWVFGTPVMVSVAKTLDAPIKVTFPRDFLAHGIFGKQLGLLGLGDIVVPGVFVAMLLRFDHSLNRSGSLKYFYTGYVAYIIGLLTTFIVMLTFNAAQPALLYLVPTCLGFPLARAWLQGDLAAMFAYEDVPQENTDKNIIADTQSEVRWALVFSDISNPEISADVSYKPDPQLYTEGPVHVDVAP